MIRGRENIDMFHGRNIKHLELLEMAQTIINCTVDDIIRKYPDITKSIFFPRFYYLNFNNATIICIVNIFEVCDICFIEFETQSDIVICRNECNNHYLQINENLWVNLDYFIECSLGMVTNGFCISWRHDEVLGADKITD